jgi:prepilin-type N-terminal cleavage/methylation domain-containing protein
MRREQGMTLIEVLVALGIFLVVLGAMVPALLSNAAANNKSEQISAAMRVATNTLEDYRVKLNNANLPSTGSVVSTVAAQGQNYTVTSIFCPTDAPSTMICSSNARYIRVIVSLAGTNIYTAETFFTQLN